MTTNNIPAPVRPPGVEGILAVLADQSKKSERNVNDPNQWIYVGNAGFPATLGPDQPWAPPFDNGFFNVGAPRCLLRYRFLRPYDPNTTQSAVQLQGSVAGGSAGQRIFTMKYPFSDPSNTITAIAVTFDSNIYLTCCDDAGDLKIITIQTDGQVIYGFV